MKASLTHLALCPFVFFLVSWLQETRIEFKDVTRQAGITFQHWSGASPEKYVLETMGSGAAFLDYDNDGWLDIYFVNGGTVPEHPSPAPVRHALYRNQKDGTFVEVTAEAGVGGKGYYGVGVSAADYDGDGWTDLFVTGFGRNLLYRNTGKGTFVDWTDRAGVGGGKWSSSAAFLDYDRDGDLDLFVARYVNFNFDRNLTCGDMVRGIRAYCHPDVYDGLSSLLYRNNGDGTFTDVSSQAGIASHLGKSLGVVAVDVDDDGQIDLYVANDSIQNFLFRNRGNGTFDETGIVSGVAFDEAGRPQAGMGAAAGDFDEDGRLDLIVTNYARENNNLYHNHGRYFTDSSFQTGFGPPSLPLVGWGTGFFDFDNDTDLDVLVVNGHVIDNIEELQPGEGSYRQSMLMLENLGGRFRDITANCGSALNLKRVGRGAAFGDYDNDGDLDVVVTNLGESPTLLRNEGGNRRPWISLRLKGTRSPSDPIGTRVKAVVAGRTLTRYLEGGGSYLSSNDHRIHLGLGGESKVSRMEIQWPSGTVDILTEVAAGKFYDVHEGKGIVEIRRSSPQ